jgi:hypothetical protein
MNEKDLPRGIIIDGVVSLEVRGADVTFLVVPASARFASSKRRGFWVGIFERRARVKEDFKGAMVRFGYQKSQKCFGKALRILQLKGAA